MSRCTNMAGGFPCPTCGGNHGGPLPKKTLEEAIGCWTTNPHALKERHLLVGRSIKRAKEVTQENLEPERLLSELELLGRRIESMDEVCQNAITRCKIIISTKETS